MNWNKLIIMSSIALSLAAVPMATAQRGHGASRGGGARAGISASGGRSFSGARSFRGQSGRAGARFNATRSSNFRNAGRGVRWQNGNRGRWGRHHGHYRRGYYPYYSYYPYYGFGYGYPYYYGGYYNGYYGNEPVYEGTAANGSIAVEVQKRLAEAGYYDGAIDGVIGNGTRRAIRRYESANGLPVDGRIDPDLLSRMGVG